MKTGTILFALILISGLFGNSFAQDKNKAVSISEIVWLGIDFTMAKFSFVTEDPAIIVNQYLPAINMLIPSQPDKFNIRKFFNKSKVTIDLDLVNEFNAKIDPSRLVTASDYKLETEAVNNAIKKYCVKGKSGTGLIFIAENLNKATQKGSYYVCFFDMKTKAIIDSRRMYGDAGGFGFRNYWAASVYNIMKIWY
jgi:hypothetical protein